MRRSHADQGSRCPATGPRRARGAAGSTGPWGTSASAGASSWPHRVQVHPPEIGQHRRDLLERERLPHRDRLLRRPLAPDAEVVPRRAIERREPIEQRIPARGQAPAPSVFRSTSPPSARRARNPIRAPLGVKPLRMSSPKRRSCCATTASSVARRPGSASSSGNRGQSHGSRLTGPNWAGPVNRDSGQASLSRVSARILLARDHRGADSRGRLTNYQVDLESDRCCVPLDGRETAVEISGLQPRHHRLGRAHARGDGGLGESEQCSSSRQLADDRPAAGGGVHEPGELRVAGGPLADDLVKEVGQLWAPGHRTGGKGWSIASTIYLYCYLPRERQSVRHGPSRL